MASVDRTIGTLRNRGNSIRRFGNGCLRQRCRLADPLSAETRELIERLWFVLGADGVGLAAPQIGVDLRVVIIRNPEASPAKSRITMINPEIRETFGPDTAFEEGCLSFPGLYQDVIRPQGVVVNYTDEGGHAHQVRDKKMFSRIVQHEVDHLDGILFVDYFSTGTKFWLWPRLAMQLMGHFVWKLRNRS